MLDYLNRITELVIWVAAAGVVAAVAVYVLAKIRGQAAQQEPSASDLLAKFREMNEDGVLADEEFRTIKSKLAGRPKPQSNDSGDKG